MDKRMLLIGVILVLAAFIIAGEGAGPIATKLQGSNATLREAVLPPNGIVAFPFSLNATSFVLAQYDSTQNVSFYVMSASAYSSIQAMLAQNMSLEAAAVSLEGNGVMEITPPLAQGSFPAAYAAQPYGYTSYLASNLSYLPAGTYYSMFYNPQVSNATVSFNYGTLSEVTFDPDSARFLVLAALAFIVFIAGAVLVIYAFIKKPKAEEMIQAAEAKAKGAKEETAAQHEADKLYARISRHGKAAAKKRTAKRKRAKRKS